MSTLYDHRRKAKPRREVVLGHAPHDWMLVDLDTRTHDPRNTAPGFRQARGVVGFTREGRAWLGDRLPKRRS